MDRELVALGMTAEIIVVLENEDARIRIRFAIEIRRGKAADASADDDQIKLLPCFDRFSGVLPEVPVAHAVSDLERTDVASAQPGQRRRIVIRRFLGIKILLKCCQQVWWKQGSAGG